MNIHSHGVMKVSHTWNKFECRINVYVRNSTEEDIQNIQHILLFPFFSLSSLVLFRRKIKRQFVETESERKIERDKKNKNTVIHSRQLFIVENFGD